ncbi:hypothetical protein [Rubrivirga sp.]|uniref:hypothetical protein n=1 Tax=Rubrivirga sp. TaxID=1885344 RepID=UPI003C77882D
MAALLVVGAAWSPVRRGTWALRALAVAAVVMGVSGALAQAGVLADLDARPPPVALLLVATSIGMGVLAFSTFGDRFLQLPLAVLVGFQAFRIAVGLLLAASSTAGIVPIEVSYHGLNFDVVTGVLGLVLGVWLWLGSPPRGLVVAWNVLGLALLATVVGVAATSAFGIFETEPRMTLPASWPGVWLPAWLVQVAFFGHLLVFRALRHDADGSIESRQAGAANADLESRTAGLSRPAATT